MSLLTTARHVGGVLRPAARQALPIPLVASGRLSHALCFSTAAEKYAAKSSIARSRRGLQHHCLPYANVTPKHGIRSLSTSLSLSQSAAEARIESPSEAAYLVEESKSEDDSKVSPHSEKNPITSQFASLKGSIAHDTFKAVTVKPFGYKEMSDVQYEVLKLMPHLSDSHLGDIPDGKGGRDLLVKARTGTGKTLGFLIPAIETRVRAIYGAERGHFTVPWQQMLDRNRPGLKFEDLDKHGRQLVARQFSHNTAGVLVLSPTRELASQIAVEAEKLVTHHKDLDVQLLVGGESRSQQLKKWRKERPDIVVATPGRILDLINSEPMVADALSAVQTLIFDEADTLLDMGFKNEIDQIVSKLPRKEDRNTMLFSATVSKEVRSIARSSLRGDHRFIDCVPAGEQNAHMHIPQSAHFVENEDQIRQVARLIALDQLETQGKSKIIVFTSTTAMTQMLKRLFSERMLKGWLPYGLSSQVFELHGKLDQKRRTRVSSIFRADQSGASVLFTTDVSARGVDYPGVTRVIQFGPPGNADQYVHRIGRTGRAGAAGRSDIVLVPHEAGFVRSVEEMPLESRDAASAREQLAELARKADEEPAPRSKSSARSFGRGEQRIATIQEPLYDRLTSGLEDAVNSALSTVTEQERMDLFMSQVGFQAGHSEHLNMDKMAIARALQKWTTACLQLDYEPHLNPGMLAKMGIRQSSPRSAGRRPFSGGSRGGYGQDRSSFSGYRGRYATDTPFGGDFSSRGRSAGYSNDRNRQRGSSDRFGGGGGSSSSADRFSGRNERFGGSRSAERFS